MEGRQSAGRVSTLVGAFEKSLNSPIRPKDREDEVVTPASTSTASTFPRERGPVPLPRKRSLTLSHVARGQKNVVNSAANDVHHLKFHRVRKEDQLNGELDKVHRISN